MADETQSRVGALIKSNETALLDAWVGVQTTAESRRTDLINASDLRAQSKEFLSLFADLVGRSADDPAYVRAFDAVREMLESLSVSRTQQGFSPSEVAVFVFSLKQPLFDLIRKTPGKSPDALADEVWAVSTLLDRLGLLTTEVYQRTREALINRQQDEMLELSTPVVKLWDGILALPMIGTLDSGRTQVVMETLLNRIVETGAEIAILDITGVPTVDTLVAQHLIKTVTAARLMGADCIISGIRPQIAQTIVHLGVDLSGVITKASLADAFLLALRRRNLRVVKDRPES